jgi:hypothetical protein
MVWDLQLEQQPAQQQAAHVLTIDDAAKASSVVPDGSDTSRDGDQSGVLPAYRDPHTASPSAGLEQQQGATTAAGLVHQDTSGRSRHISWASNVASSAAKLATAAKPSGPPPLDAQQLQAAIQQAAARGFYGWGTQGTEPKHGITVMRALIVMSVISTLIYLVWRALRTLTPGLWYTCSMPFWVMEAVTFVSGLAFMLSLWYQIERPERLLCDMLPDEQDFPHVDVFIVTYSEPCEVLEPTIIAAINMNYPGAKLTVHVLDDGCRAPVYKMVKRLQYQCK